MANKEFEEIVKNLGFVGNEPSDIKSITIIKDVEAPNQKKGIVYVDYNNDLKEKIELKEVTVEELEKKFGYLIEYCCKGAQNAKKLQSVAWNVYSPKQMIADRKEAEYEEYEKVVAAVKEEQAKEALKKAELEKAVQEKVEAKKQAIDEAKENEKNNTLKGVAIGAGTTLAAAALVGGGILLGSKFGNKEEAKDADTKDTTTTIETSVTEATEIKYANTVNLEGKTWADIENMINNGEINEVQAEAITKLANWLNDTNVSEDWEKVTLTDEELKAANELLKTLDKEELDGNDVRFGFTAEEVLALALRYNNYSNEEFAKILGGKQVDVNKVMNEDSNKAIANIIVYLINSDNYEMNLGNIVRLSEKEANRTEELNSMLKEYKKLLNDKKYDEAKDQMKEFEDALIKTAYNEDLSADYRELIINTYGASASAMSIANGYKNLFTEETMKSMILGNSENDDVKRSLADEACGAQKERLEQYNTYINNLENKNIAAEAAFAATAGIDAEMGLNNVATEYDTVTEKTVDMEAVISIVNEELTVNEKDAKNMQYFSTVSLVQKYTNMNENAKNSVTGGKPGDYIIVDKDGNVVIAEEIPAELVGTKKVSEAEKAKKDKEVQAQAQVDYQGIYDAAYSAFINGQNFTGYDANDSLAAAAVGMARSDADSYLAAKAQEGQVTGGEVTPVEIEGNGKSYPSEQAPSNGGETTVEVVNPTVTEPVVEPEPTVPVEEGTSLAEAAQEAGLTGDDIAWLFDADIEVEGDLDIKTY